jgi:hypothetical protein
MPLPDIVRSSQGLMVGDYSSADVIPAGATKGNAISVFAMGVDDTTSNQGMYVAPGGLPIGAGTAKKQPASPALVTQAQQDTQAAQPEEQQDDTTITLR